MILPGCFTKTRLISLLVLLPLALSSVAFAATDDCSLSVVEKNRDGCKRVALVIGNSSYRSSPLKNSANDAHSMAATLRRLGFEVEEKTDLGYKEMNTSVEGFCEKLKSGGVGLFYYAGHGMQVNGNNYLIPVDSQIEEENEVIYKAIDAGHVLARMEQSKSGVNLIILDACRDNPFSRSFRPTSQGLASMDVPNGTFIAYATNPGNTADDGDGKNGLYTAELVNAMETPGIPLEQVFKQTLKAVREKSGSKQTPCFASKLEEEFYFIQPSSMTDIRPSSVWPQPVSHRNFESRPSAGSYGTTALHAPTTGVQFVNVPDGCLLLSAIFGGWFSDEVCSIVFSIGTYNRPIVSRRR